MNISFDWYNVFYYVCEFKSVTKAANFLYVSQPAITKIIRKLENALGKQLIVKTPNGINITDEGIKIYNKIKDPIESIISSTMLLLDENEQYNQILKINCGVSSVKKYLLDSICDFNIKYPNIKFIFDAVETNVSLKQLQDGKVDLVFISLSALNNKKISNIEIIEWKDTTECFVISKDVKDNYPDFIPSNEINNYPIIAKSYNSYSFKNVENEFKEHNLNFLPKYHVSNHWLVEEYVKKGLGIGVVIYNLVEEEIKNGEYVLINTDIKFKKRKFGYAYRTDSSKILIIKEFVKDL